MINLLHILARNAKWLVPLVKYIYKLIKLLTMSDRKGLLTEAQEKFLAEWLDKKIKFNNVVVEGIDGKAFLVALRVVDNMLLEKVPENWQSELEPVIDALIANDIGTEAEFTALGSSANDIKATGTGQWTTSNGTNTTGFSAVGGGFRSETDGSFGTLKTTAEFWCGDVDKNVSIEDGTDVITIASADLARCCSIRLVKD